MPFRWTINPYRGCSHACVYCFARPTHTYLDFNAGRDFEKEIVVKVNVPEVLRVELARPSWKGEHIAMGTNTDPYQWVEGRYKLMRGIWEALRDAANPCSVLTKSPLLLRDLDLMKEIAAVTDISANLSVPDDRREGVAGERAAHAAARGRGWRPSGELNRAGIPTGILVAPLMPGINDDPRQVEEILEAAGEAGATGVSGIALHLRGEVRGIFMEWLRSYRPDLVERYEELYARGAYAAASRAGAARTRCVRRAPRARPTVGALPARAGPRVRAPDARWDRGARATTAARPEPEQTTLVLIAGLARAALCDHRHSVGAIPTGQGGVVLVRKRSSRPRRTTHEEAVRHPEPLLARGRPRAAAERPRASSARGSRRSCMVPIADRDPRRLRLPRRRCSGPTYETPVQIVTTVVLIVLGWQIARDVGPRARPDAVPAARSRDRRHRRLPHPPGLRAGSPSSIALRVAGLDPRTLARRRRLHRGHRRSRGAADARQPHRRHRAAQRPTVPRRRARAPAGRRHRRDRSRAS